MKIDLAVISAVGAVAVLAAGVVGSYAVLQTESSHSTVLVAGNTSDIRKNTDDINKLSRGILEQKIILKNVHESLEEAKEQQKERYKQTDQKLDQIIRNLGRTPIQ